MIFYDELILKSITLHHIICYLVWSFLKFSYKYSHHSTCPKLALLWKIKYILAPIYKCDCLRLASWIHILIARSQTCWASATSTKIWQNTCLYVGIRIHRPILPREIFQTYSLNTDGRYIVKYQNTYLKIFSSMFQDACYIQASQYFYSI